MKALRFGRSAALLSVAALALTACSSADNGGNGGASTTAPAGSSSAAEGGATSDVQGNLVGAGASSQEAAMTAWTQGVSSVAPNLTVQYSPDGSGAGREKFLQGATSFAGSDAAMDEEEAEQAKQVCGDQGAFHVPAYISPIAVAYNLPGVEENIKMDAETIARVFTGEITTWNDEAIASQNEGVELPDTPITVVHRSDDSGTTENFTAYLTEAAGDAWSYDEVETWPADITAESAQGTTGVVGLVSSNEGAITYADASAVDGLGTVDVKVGEEYVAYSAEAAAATVEKSEANEDGSIELDRATTEAGVYPVVLVSYHIYCNQYKDQETADQVKAFAEYVISEDGQSTAEGAAGNAPISAATRDAAMERIEAISAQG
ncbi:phosphate ABC transporter substrate-binding protein PstS [uncultured Micrococcus sp.]|uniref:phosphate ABC transporter substrate-binding protein PstS n=1 Tax=uncultured Micrococcus sp. TaxID=114051 RepID=UPI0025EF0D62|nr:phosphate ABC transporter substrate-binding protein PstS [uncultured Micrococcus sp.]